MDENKEGRIAQSLKDAISKLKINIDNAFADEFEDKQVHYIPYDFSSTNTTGVYIDEILELADLFLETIKNNLSVEEIMSKIVKIIKADSIVLWVQKKDVYSVLTGQIGNEEGRKLFLTVLPELAKHDETSLAFTHDNAHYLAYTSSLSDLTMALLIVRDKNLFSFTKYDMILGNKLAEIIFSRV